MVDALGGIRLTETVMAALRLASTRRSGGERPLDTQTLLLTLEAVDVSGDWSRFVVTDFPQHEPDGISGHTWENVPLTRHCGEALSRARVLAERFGLVPLPPGALALALVWDATSGAARSFVATTHEDLVADIQQDLLGTELDGLSGLLSAPLHHAPSRDDPPPPPVVADRPRLTDARLERALAQVTARLPLWLLRLLVVAALVGIVFGLTTNPAWTFRPEDDLAPPLPRPAIATAIPDDATVSRSLGIEFVRVHDGLPLNERLFDSMAPFWYDTRTQVVNGARAAQWDSTDGRSKAVVQLVQLKTRGPFTLGTQDCLPTEKAVVRAPVLHAGYIDHDANYAEYCLTAFDRQTQVYVGVLSVDPQVIAAAPAGVEAMQVAIRDALPSPDFRVLTGIPMRYSAAQLNRGLLLAAITLPLLWALPTLLFDRATWQRLWWTLSLRRFRSRSSPGLDIDLIVRGRLWSAAALSCAQVCAAVWAFRVTTDRGVVATAVTVVGAVLAISAIPRLLYLRRIGRSQVFAGSRRLLWLVGTSVGIVTVGFAVFLMWLANVMSVFGGVGQGADYVQQRFNIVLELLCVPAALLAIAPSMLLRRIAMRALRTRELQDQRNPILLLRSFADDRRRLRARSSHRRALVDRLSLRRWERFEEVVAASLGAHGPVFAVGQVGERLPPPLGAVRRQFSDAEWRDRIQELMAGAAVISVTLGRSNALDWEIRRIAQLGFLPKTIFVLPPTSRSEHRKRLAVLAAALDLDWADLDVTQVGDWVLSVRVPAVGAQPQVIRARAQEDVAYDIALELARLGTLGLDLRAPSIAAGNTASAPRPEVYATGKTPAFKPLLRRKATWVAIPTIASSIITLGVTFIAGEMKDTSSIITLNDEDSWWAVAADPDSTEMYGVLNGVGLTRLDFEGETGTIVCRIEAADDLVAAHGWLFASNRASGTLQAIDPASERVVWTRRDLPGLRGVVATDTTVYVLLPAAHEVRALDRRSGEMTATADVNGIPWASTLNGRSLFVSLIDSATVVQLTKESLTPSAHGTPGIDATQLVAADGTVWAYSVTRHRVVALSGPRRGAVIHTRSQNPHLASNGTVLAIEGVEQMSTLWPDGHLRRNRLVTRHADRIAVTPAGDVLAINDQDVLLIRASKR